MGIINDTDVDSLEQLELWLTQEYPDKMQLSDVDEFQRVKLAGATELALYLVSMFKLNRGEV